MQVRNRILSVALAIGAALAMWLVAPESWEGGAGSLEISLLDRPVLALPIEIGTITTVTGSARDGSRIVEVEASDGIPTDRRIEIEVRVDPPAELGDIAVTIIGPDGQREMVPVLRRGDDGVFTAVRHPPTNVGVVLALLGAVIVLWVSEVIPVFVTALMVPVALAFTGVATARDAMAPFFDPIIVLFFAGFLMAEAMRRVRLDHRAAITVVAKAGRSPATLFAAVIGISAFMSMWMSNTAAVAVLLPIVLAVTAPMNAAGYRKAMVLGLAYAATIGGVGSAIGTPANLLAIDFIDSVAGRQITFVEWFAFGLPMVVVFVPILGVYLWWASEAQVDRDLFESVHREAVSEFEHSGPLSAQQWAVLAIFAAVLAGWLTQAWHGQSPGMVALAGAVVMFAVGLIEPDDVQRISWPTLLTFGGGLTLGVHMVDTGASDWVVSRLEVLASWPTFLAISATALVALTLTTVASNTGSAAALIPLAIPLAGLIGVDPVLLVAVVAIASSVDFALVVGTPPTMLAYSTELFTVREILRKGAILDVAGILLLLAVVVPFWQVLGIV